MADLLKNMQGSTLSEVLETVPTTLLDDDPTSVTGAAIGCKGLKRGGLFLVMTKVATPTANLYAYLEFSSDGGTTWAAMRSGYWGGGIQWSPASIGSGRNESHDVPFPGGATHVRLRFVSAGTDATNKYQVQASIGGTA